MPVVREIPPGPSLTAHKSRSNIPTGNFQSLPNGNAFLCWAYSSRISEHTPDGQVAMQAVLGEDNIGSYRGFKYPWIGLPSRPPDVHSEAVWNRSDILTTIHVSWNGATEVYKWIFTMIDENNHTHAGERRRITFETSFLYHGYAATVFAEAFDETGESLGKSDVIFTEPPTQTGIESPRRHPGQERDKASTQGTDETSVNVKEQQCIEESKLLGDPQDAYSSKDRVHLWDSLLEIQPGMISQALSIDNKQISIMRSITSFTQEKLKCLWVLIILAMILTLMIPIIGVFARKWRRYTSHQRPKKPKSM